MAYTYEDLNAPPPITLLPECDAIFEILSVDQNIVQQGKTAGSVRYDLHLRLENPEHGVGSCYEIIIDHPSTKWKMDTLLKSSGVAVQKGQALTFNFSEYQSDTSLTYVDLKGLRGWCKVGVEAKRVKDKATGNYVQEIGPGGKPLWKNRVVAFYTDRPKLEPNRTEPASTEGDGDKLPF